MSHPTRTIPAAVVLFAGCLAYSLAVISVGWDNAILDDHAFRQTQTAISSYYLVGKPFTLAYETPVLGPPWSVPFEFPLYQWLAARVAELGVPLDQAGRLVSVGFFYLCLLPAYQVLGGLGLGRDARLTTLAVLLVSPFYLFWSRTFLIESAALFFSLSYLAFVLQAVKQGGRRALLGTAACGALAALVKVTTFAAFLGAAGLVMAADAWQRHRAGRQKAAVSYRLVLLLAAAVLPVALGLAWTRFADATKAQNPLGRDLTSAALHAWNFGTPGQRRSAATWAAIAEHAGLVTGHLAVLLACAVGVAYAGRRRGQFALCLLLAAAAPLVFLNLHYVHEYYTYANGIFLVGAVGVSLAASAERDGAYRRAGRCVLGLVLAVSAFTYVRYYYPKQAFREHEVAAVSAAVRDATQPDDVVVIVGCDWSAEVPYYSRRRALMVPAWRPDARAELPGLLQGLKGYRVGALVVKADGAEPEPGAERMAAVIGPASRLVYSDGRYAVYGFRASAPPDAFARRDRPAQGTAAP